MKTIVSDQRLPEGEIKPSLQVSEFRHKLEVEFRRFLGSGVDLQPCGCPGCGSDAAVPAFQKSGLNYIECTVCASVYASPRPGTEDIEAFYRKSEAIAYWRDVLLPDTRSARLKKIIAPRAGWIMGTIDRYSPVLSRILDIGQHSSLLVTELLKSLSPDCTITVAGEYADLEIGYPDSPSVIVAPSAINQLRGHGPVDLVLAFDSIDRASDLESLLLSVHSVLNKRGLLLAGSTLISGFDLQTTWNNAEGISPPESLNLLTVQGVLALCKRHGFEVLEFSTPGIFDVEIVQRAVRANPDAQWPRFLRYLMTRCEPEVLEGFQEFLQKYRLSSFARLALRKI